MKALGIESGSKKITKGGSTSKGGTIGKKEREVINMTKGSTGFETLGE
jgi:hypothetical protein